jgi:hypothetical protein
VLTRRLTPVVLILECSPTPPGERKARGNGLTVEQVSLRKGASTVPRIRDFTVRSTHEPGNVQPCLVSICGMRAQAFKGKCCVRAPSNGIGRTAPENAPQILWESSVQAAQPASQCSAKGFLASHIQKGTRTALHRTSQTTETPDNRNWSICIKRFGFEIAPIGNTPAPCGRILTLCMLRCKLKPLRLQHSSDPSRAYASRARPTRPTGNTPRALHRHIRRSCISLL